MNSLNPVTSLYLLQSYLILHTSCIQLLPPLKQSGRNLRKRGCGLILPEMHYSFF